MAIPFGNLGMRVISALVLGYFFALTRSAFSLPP